MSDSSPTGEFEHLTSSARQSPNFTPLFAVGDFSYNYLFVYQNTVQGIIWRDPFCTLKSWMCHYKRYDNLNNISITPNRFSET